MAATEHTYGLMIYVSKALGVKLPQKPKTSASDGGRTALWLGPDEWLVLGPDWSAPDGAGLERRLRATSARERRA